MAIHQCVECGLLHDHGSPVVNAEVEIARLNNEAQIRIAEINARADRAIATTEADATVQAAEAEADAMQAVYADQEADEHVAEAVASVAAGLDPAGDPEAEPEPVPEIENTQINVEPEVPAPPVHEHHEPPAKPRKTGLFSAWG